MSRIISYPYDDSIKAKDAWVGTDEASRQTKQYTAEALAEYLNISGSISIIGQMTYKYGTTPLNGIGTLAVFGGGPDIVAFSAVVKLTLSNQDISNQRVVEFLDLLVGSDILIAEQGAISTFGYYSIDSYAINATDSNYYDLGVTFKSGNGSMRSDRIYEAQNFTLSAEENISTLQTTIDSGNTYQENGTSPLWTWDSGGITVDGSGTLDGYSGIFSGKYVRLQSDLYPNYTTLANGVLVLPLPGSISSNARLFANPSMESPGEIDLLLPSTPGTLALTTDITSSPWDTVAGGINYANGNVGIGTTNPGYALTIKSSGNASQNFLLIQNSSNNSMFTVASDPSGNANLAVRNSAGIAKISINTAGDSFFAGGNVGIGTTSPIEKLDVNGNIRVADEGEIYIQGSTATRKIVRLDNTSDSGLITLDRSDQTKVAISANFVTHGHTYFNGLSTNVGIGTDSPSQKLEVAGNIELNSGALIISGTPAGQGAQARYISGAATTNDLWLNVPTNGRYRFAVADSQKVEITAAGNVGIGTTSPNQKLDVNGNISIATTSGSSASNQISMVGSRAIFGYDGSISSAFMRSSDTSKPLVFGSGTSELMRIVSSTGNVGIGTTSPAHKFEVHGLSSGAIGFNGSNVKIGNVSSIGYQRIFPTGNSLKYSVGTEGAHQFVYGVDNSTMMHISYSGKVGIGTTNPSQKLEVDGQVLSDGYRLAAMQTAPATRNSAGTLGEIVIDGNHIYVCYATDSWSRVALETSW